MIDPTAAPSVEGLMDLVHEYIDSGREKRTGDELRAYATRLAAPPAAPQGDDDRVRFEAQMRTQAPTFNEELLLGRTAKGNYSSLITNHCWLAVQAALAAERAKPNPWRQAVDGASAERERCKVLAVWAHNALAVLATLDGEDMEDGGHQLRILKDRGERLVHAVLYPGPNV